MLYSKRTRWKYGIPPANNANYAWIEHIISKLSPNGVAGFVLANGSMSTSTKAEAEIRKNIIEEVRGHEYILTPGRYVGIEEAEDDGEPFDEKMTRLIAELAELFC